MKIASISQAILQAARARVLLAPLQFGLGVQMHYYFGSRFLIDRASTYEDQSTGCLTRGRGMTEQQRLTWVMAMPSCAEVNKIKRNKGMSVTRQDRDWKDTNTVLRYHSDRNPFTSDIGLQNNSTGVHAHCSIDVDQA